MARVTGIGGVFFKAKDPKKAHTKKQWQKVKLSRKAKKARVRQILSAKGVKSIGPADE